MQFRYAVLYNASKPEAVVYYQLVNLSDAGLGGILNLAEYGGLASSVSTRINDLIFSPGNGRKSFLLVCGNLLSSGDHAIASTSKESFRAALESITPIKKIITQSLGSDSKIVALMVKDFYADQNEVAAYALKKEYFSLNTDPEMIFEVNPEWNSFNDYLSALSSKYRIRANNARKLVAHLTIKDLSLDEIIDSRELIFALNEQVMRKAPVKLAKPSIEYFINLKKEFGNNYNIRGFFNGENLVAFTSAFFNSHHFEAHYIGLDYNLNKEFGLYQNILYSYIDEAIRMKSARLFFGRTALEIKSTTGARPHELACYFRFANRIINVLAKPLVSSTGPRNWIPRDPFRQ